MHLCSNLQNVVMDDPAVHLQGHVWSIGKTHYFFDYGTGFFFLSKTSPKIWIHLLDGSRFLGLFERKKPISQKFKTFDVDIWDHSRAGSIRYSGPPLQQHLTSNILTSN